MEEDPRPQVDLGAFVIQGPGDHHARVQLMFMMRPPDLGKCLIGLRYYLWLSFPQTFRRDPCVLSTKIVDPDGVDVIPEQTNSFVPDLDTELGMIVQMIMLNLDRVIFMKEGTYEAITSFNGTHLHTTRFPVRVQTQPSPQ